MHASHARQCNSMHSRAFGELNCKNKSSSSIYFEIYHRRLVGSTMCPLSEYVRLRFVLITCANSLMVDLNSDHPPCFISHPFPCQSPPFKWRYCASTRIIYYQSIHCQPPPPPWPINIKLTSAMSSLSAL